MTLANRNLERLPGCLPRTLRSLNASHNLLRALSASELGHLEQLQVLTLSHNRIAELRWGPGGPAGLHTLDLNYNQLAALTPCAGPALSSLRALALAGNPLQALQPRAFACFPALQLLNLSCTALGRGARGASPRRRSLERMARLWPRSKSWISAARSSSGLSQGGSETCRSSHPST